MIYSLGSNDGIAKKIAARLSVRLGVVTCKVFADGEQYVQFQDSLRGRDIFLIQSTNAPAEHWVRLLLAIDAARGASARSVNVVIPYFGYARQDRKSKPREPIAARVFAMLLEHIGASRVLTMDLHNSAIGGFFRTTNLEYLYARPVLVAHMRSFFKKAIAKDEIVVVSPDAGGVARAQSYAKRLMRSADLALIHKERDIPNHVARMKLVGDVRGKIALIIDDIADTCGTLVTAAELLIHNGARDVYAAVTHGVLSGDASEKIERSPLSRLFITDTIAIRESLSPKIECVSVAHLFADAIKRIEQHKSLTELFESE